MSQATEYNEPAASVEAATKQLDRVLGFFPRVESKASFLFAVNSTMLGVLAINIQRADFFSLLHATPAALSVLAIFASLSFIYRCTFPNLAGGHASLIYFREIAKLRESEYVTALKQQTTTALFDDLASQIWRNSEILGAKFNAMKYAFLLTALALIPWSIFLTVASITHTQFPIIK